MRFFRSLALWLAAAIVVGIGTIGTLASADDTAAKVVVASPFAERSALAVIASADGRVLRTGRWPWVAVGTDERADFPARLRQAGAWFVLPAALAVFCQANRPA